MPATIAWAEVAPEPMPVSLEYTTSLYPGRIGRQKILTNSINDSPEKTPNGRKKAVHKGYFMGHNGSNFHEIDLFSEDSNI